MRLRRALPWFVLGTLLILTSCCLPTLGIGNLGRWTSHQENPPIWINQGGADSSNTNRGDISNTGSQDWGSDSGSWDSGGSNSGSWNWDGNDSGSWDSGGSNSGTWNWGGSNSGSWDSGGSNSGSW